MNFFPDTIEEAVKSTINFESLKEDTVSESDRPVGRLFDRKSYCGLDILETPIDDPLIAPQQATEKPTAGAGCEVVQNVAGRATDNSNRLDAIEIRIYQLSNAYVSTTSNPKPNEQARNRKKLQGSINRI